MELEQLRATLKSDLEEKNEILDKLTHERGSFFDVLHSTASNSLQRREKEIKGSGTCSFHLCLLPWSSNTLLACALLGLSA